MKMKQKLAIALSFCLLAGLLFVIPGIGVSAADNLAANGDLELGNTSGWEIANASVASDVKYAGNYSLKLTATSAYNGAAYKVVPVGKGATVTVSFYYRYDTNPGSNKAYHVFTYQGDNANQGTYSGADKSLTIPSGCTSITTWQQVSYSFDSGDYANIYLKFCPGSNGSGTCYIDNLVVTATGGTEEEVDPYLTSFGTKYNRPSNANYNLIKNGGFETTDGAQWNTASFLGTNLQVVADSTAYAGDSYLKFASTATTPAWHTFPVAVEKYTQYTFSAWVKSPRLSATNRATATFGVANAQTGEFLVYQPYNGNGNGSASLSTTSMQLMATSPDDEWHLRSVVFYSGTATTVNVAICGAQSHLYLDDIALYKSAYGVEYISELRTATITTSTNTGNKYCEDAASLIPAPHMTGKVAEEHWSDNPAWRNGFLSFVDTGDSHATALKYTASSKTMLKLTYMDWIDVQPNTTYTLTMDVKRLSSGGGKIALLDDNYDSPAEFYTLSFSATDSDWQTYSITFNTGVYSRIGLAIVDGGGSAYIDKTRLFKSADGIATEPTDEALPTLKPLGGQTSAMEMETQEPAESFRNGGFEQGSLADYIGYQFTSVSADAAHTGAYGAHLKGDGGWGALLEQKSIPVQDGHTYVLTYWYKAQSGGANVSLYGSTTNTQYAYEWASKGEWTQVVATFKVEGDTTLWLNLCGGGNGIAEDIYIDDISLMEQDPGALLGVAFMLELEAQGVTYDERFVGDLTTASVDVYGDGESYKLVKMGAVMTNLEQVGTDPEAFTLDNLSISTVDIHAKYLYNVTDTTAYYAVRIINIPYACRNVQIYARPYYVFEKDGQQIVVYGDIYNRSYEQE